MSEEKEQMAEAMLRVRVNTVYEQAKEGGNFLRLLTELVRMYVEDLEGVPPEDMVQVKILRESEAHVCALAYSQMVMLGLSPYDQEVRQRAAYGLMMDLVDVKKRFDDANLEAEVKKNGVQ